MPNWILKRTWIFIALFLVNLSAVVALWWSGSHSLFTSGNYLIAIGRLLGLMGEYLILTQLILVSRIKYVEQTYGFPKLNWLHRRLGYYILGTVLLHPVFITLGYARVSHKSFLAQLYLLLTTWEDVLWAFLGLCLLAIIIGISVSIVRKRLRYETWYFIHLGIYVAIALIFQHQTNFADVSSGKALWYWLALNYFVFGLALMYRAVRPLYYFFQYRFRVERVIEEGPGIYSVYVGGRNISRYPFEAGQYANLTFLKYGMWFTHPFSFSSIPGKEELRFTIKGAGDFTNRIQSLTPKTKVVIEGPLGAFTIRQAKKRKFLLIAGGIGITPIRSFLESLLLNNADVKVLYSAKTEKELIFKSELDHLTSMVRYFVTEEAVTGTENKRIDLSVIKADIPDWQEREIYICGPVLMIKQLEQALVESGISKFNIHHEIFAY